ncbi:GNAT family N-acetyltransferase [bacterium]|nr:GNAT family N-acetyltransferase [bacterium]
MTEPTIRILEPGDEALLEAFLLPRLDSSMFLLSNMRAAGLRDEGQLYGGTYAALIESGEIAGVAVHYWNGSIIFQAPTHETLLWRAAVEASGRGIGGMVGPAAQVAAARCPLVIGTSLIMMDGIEKLYSLDLEDLIVPDDLRSGRVVGRRIEPRDLDILLQWRIDYEVEVIGVDPTPAFREKTVAFLERTQRVGLMWVLEHYGEPVSCTAFNAVTAEAVQVGGVWTPPGLRSRGYARAAVAHSLVDARAEGVARGILFTGMENTAAQRAYEAVGFEHVSDYCILLLKGRVSIGPFSQEGRQ